MNLNKYYYITFLTALIIIGGCAGSKLGSKKKEKVLMAPRLKTNVINYALVKKQEKPVTMDERGTSRGAGLIDAYTGGLVTMGVTAVKNFIANDKKKYTDTWTQGLNDIYFYDQPSSIGPLDPAGMQFSGFNIKRTLPGKNKKDTLVALSADFVLDTTNYDEIINDGIFRLRLKNIELHYAKAKVPLGKDFLNVDFEITFTTSFIGENGQLNKDIELGKFYYSLRKAPLDTNYIAPRDSAYKDYKSYYAKLENTKLTGKCFIVPRSYGYYRAPNNKVSHYYNKGAFSIAVKVTESSKDSFVNEMLINTSGIGIDYGSGVIMEKVAPSTKPKK